MLYARCLKIAEKVSLHNIASEASYVYFLDRSSLKMPKMVNLARTNFKCDILSDFQTMCLR